MENLISQFGTEQNYQIEKNGLNVGILTGTYKDAQDLKSAVKIFAKINMKVAGKTTITEVSTGNVLFINVK